jgi:acetoin utilization deacetylase AcuC-like enzyme
LEHATQIDLRRADYVLWYLIQKGFFQLKHAHRPEKILYRQLGLVHSAHMLDSLSKEGTIARAFGVDGWDVPIDEVLGTARLACKATLEATQEVLQNGGFAGNLLGGFHHAFPEKPGGLCLLNDIAVAIAVVRQEGFQGSVAVLDLDAHPPDGTAACLYRDSKAWIGSISGSDWGDLPGVDETVLPNGSGDELYLQTLDQLLKRMTPPDLAFVVAGGDVLSGDHFGTLALSLAGARERDLRVAKALANVPTVWLPGGGYQSDAWKVMAGTICTAFLDRHEPIPRDYEPLKKHYHQIYHALDETKLKGPNDSWLTQDDLNSMFGLGAKHGVKLMDFYSEEGLEFAYYRYGILETLRRMGYSRFQFRIRRTSTGDQLKVAAHFAGQSHILVEVTLKNHQSPWGEVLFINWLTLRHPKGQFSAEKPKLPGQEVPGLGLAKEAVEMLFAMSKRLGLVGICFRPSWYHIAYTCRYHFSFADEDRQARFLAMNRDLRHIPLVEATQLAAKGAIFLNGAPYTWEAEDMFFLENETLLHHPGLKEKMSHYHFEIKPGH